MGFPGFCVIVGWGGYCGGLDCLLCGDMFRFVRFLGLQIWMVWCDIVLGCLGGVGCCGYARWVVCT